MNTDYIFLNPAPMPYLTDCDYKKFEPNEYHISRIVDFFVLIFMLRGSLHFIEDGIPVSVHEGEWYIQRKNLRQGAGLFLPRCCFLLSKNSAACFTRRRRTLLKSRVNF